VDADLSSLPDDIDALKAALIAPRTEAAAEKACAVAAVAELAQGRVLIAHLNLEIESCGARFTDLAPSARRGCSTNWSFSSRRQRPTRPKMSSPPNIRSPPPRSDPSRASGRRENRSRIICRVSAS
jgi:hypothetical protein